MKASCSELGPIAVVGVYVRFDGIDNRTSIVDIPECCDDPYANSSLGSSCKVIEYVFKLMCSARCDNPEEYIESTANGSTAPISEFSWMPSTVDNSSKTIGFQSRSKPSSKQVTEPTMEGPAATIPISTVQSTSSSLFAQSRMKIDKRSTKTNAKFMKQLIPQFNNNQRDFMWGDRSNDELEITANLLTTNGKPEEGDVDVDRYMELISEYKKSNHDEDVIGDDDEEGGEDDDEGPQDFMSKNWRLIIFVTALAILAVCFCAILVATAAYENYWTFCAVIPVWLSACIMTQWYVHDPDFLVNNW